MKERARFKYRACQSVLTGDDKVRGRFRMLGGIAALILLFCLVVCICLYYRAREYDCLEISHLRNENQELRKNLRELRGTGEYKSSRRLEDLERYIDQHIQRKKPDTTFAATFEAVGMDSIEDSLHQMIARAE